MQIETTAQVVDTNNRPVGAQKITIEVLAGTVFMLMLADGTVFYHTNKTGTSNGHPGAAPAGTMMFELRTDDDRRAWVDSAGTYVHLD